MKLTINDFLQNPNNSELKIWKTNSGHVSNGAWMILPKYMPKVFNKKIESLLLDDIPDGQFIIDGMSKREFFKLELIEPSDLKNDEMEAIGYQCEKFQVFFKKEYVLYLLKHIRKLKIIASSPKEPAKLILHDGIFGDVEFGILMPCWV